MSIYAAMLKCGIPMSDADNTELHRYLRVLQFNSKRDKAEKKNKKAGTVTKQDAKGNVIELRRGTIDEFW